MQFDARVVVATLRHVTTVVEHLGGESVADVDVPRCNLGSEALPEILILRSAWGLPVEAIEEVTDDGLDIMERILLGCSGEYSQQTKSRY